MTRNHPEQNTVLKQPNLMLEEFDAHVNQGSLCLVFTGITGSGKTTIGRRLAQSSNIALIDIDEEIQRHVLAKGPLRESVLTYSRSLSEPVRALIETCLQRKQLPSESETQVLKALENGPLLLAALNALVSNTLNNLAPLTFFSLSAEGQRAYSLLEEQLTLQAVTNNTPRPNGFTLVSSAGSLSTLNHQALSAIRSKALLVHFKTEPSDWKSSLKQASQKPMVMQPGESLRELLMQREQFYCGLCHVSFARSRLWQVQRADDLISLIREALYCTPSTEG